MSMSVHFVQIHPDLLKKCIKNPKLLETVFSSGTSDESVSEIEMVLNFLPENHKVAMQRMMENMLPEQLDSLKFNLSGAALQLKKFQKVMSDENHNIYVDRYQIGKTISIDKSWQGINYLLTGSIEPGDGFIGQVILGGKEIGEDMGYGPARYFECDIVHEINNSLSKIAVEKLLQNYNPDTMEKLKLYPGNWNAPDCREWLGESFKEIQNYFEDTAVKNFASISYII